MNVQAMAQQYGLDANALESLLSFLRNALEQPGMREAAATNPNELLKAGVKAWRDKGQAFYQELLEGKTERSIQYRKAIAEQVWIAARNQQQGATA